MRAFCRLGLAVTIVGLSVSSISARDPEKVLLEETRLEFIRTPLIQVLSFLSDQHDVQIAIDVRTDVNEGITRNIKGIPLGPSLESILTPLGLKYRADSRAIIVEPIDPKAYFARVREKRKQEMKVRAEIPKPAEPTPHRPISDKPSDPFR